MPGIIKPVGPKDPKIYWFRRLLLIGALASTFVLVVNVVTNPTETKVNSASELNPSENIATALPLPSQTTEIEVAPTENSVPLAMCTDSEISLAVSVSAQSPKVLEGLTLTMTLTNISDNPCQRDVGSGANEITVISGPALIWSSDFVIRVQNKISVLWRRIKRFLSRHHGMACKQLKTA